MSGFLTRQRESSLAREGFIPISLDAIGEWRMAGHGGFRRVGPNTIESEGGPGVLWYPRQAFADFVLLVDWLVSSADDNSGLFLRLPALDSRDPDADARRAVDEGYEVQIDERGVDPEARTTDSPWHVTGAIYRRAPARVRVFRAVGEWNTFEITACGSTLSVRLNGVPVSELTGAAVRPGHIGLQAHHPGSRVRFRSLQIKPL